VRSTLKQLLGAISSSRLLRARAIRHFQSSVNVVYYHLVGPSTPYYAAFHADCTFDRFRRDIDELAEVFRFATLEEVCSERSDADTSDTRPTLAITFDDGFRMNQEQVLELFDLHRIKATSFLTTACVDNENLMWRHKLSAIGEMATADRVVREYNLVAARHGLLGVTAPGEVLSRSRQWPMRTKDELADELWSACGLPPLTEFLGAHAPYFTWVELAEWQSAGHGIGLHTKTHPFCSRLDHDGIVEEIIEPAEALRSRFHLETLALSYPFGDRIDSEWECGLVETGVVDHIFGIDGFAPRGSPPQRLERAGLEEMGVGWPVYGQTLTASARRWRGGNAA
jgi:peptidoglycan/xylan/chitin deacetylase (PgdA/CDA1 family)